jgi:phosphatidylinositol alpha-1,6-mannosyltransferase
MERLSHELITNVLRRLDGAVISWGRSQAGLPLFLPLALARAVAHLSTGRFDVIHIGDALLAPLGVLLGRLSGRPVAVNLHGLDMTYPNPVYQWMIRRFLPRLDAGICISRHTREIALRRGFPPDRTRVIPCGIEVGRSSRSIDRATARRALQSITGRPVEGRSVGVTVGRLVRRKGVRRFVSGILPRIVEEAPDYLYVVVGGGEEESGIRRAVEEAGMEDHVSMPGRVGAAGLEAVYAAADLFVMPNIPVENDVEGFGIVAIEASLAGLPVVASALEGITDAVADGKNGVLVEPGDDEAFARAVLDLLRDEGRRARLAEEGRAYTARTYGWDRVAGLYVDLFRECARRRAPAQAAGEGSAG